MVPIFAIVGALLLLQTLCLVYALRVVPRWVDRKIEQEKAQLAESLRSFVESPSDEQPSPLAVMADQFAILFAGRLWSHVEARVRGANGPVIREANKAEAAAVMASNPLVGIVSAIIPKKYKRLLENNPQFAGAIQAALGGGANPGDNHDAAVHTPRRHRE